jgi:hypothetical protein
LAKVDDPLQQGTVLSMLKGFWEQHQVPRSLIIPHHSSSFLIILVIFLSQSFASSLHQLVAASYSNPNDAVHF